MKYLSLSIIAASFLFALQTVACPNLSGTYVCPLPNSTQQSLTISQTLQNGVTVYSFDYGQGITNEFIADNVTRSFPDSPALKNGTVTDYCDGNKLVDTITGKAYDVTGAFIGDLIDTTTTISVIGDTLSMDASGVLRTPNDGDKESLDVSCSRVTK